MAKKGVDYRKKDKKPSAMEYIGEISLSLSFDLICRKMLGFASEVMGYKNCAILLVDEKKNELYVKDLVGYSKRFKNFNIPIDSPKGLIPLTVKKKKTYYSPDVSKEERYLKFSERIKSELVIPLIVKDRVFGVINVESEKLDGFTPQDIRLFEMLASTTSIAMENSRLFENLSALKAFNENIVMSMEEGILLEDENGMIQFLNPRAEEMLGSSLEELQGKHWTTIVPEEYREKIESETKKRPKGMSSRYEAAITTKEGEIKSIIISARPLFEGKKFRGVLSVFTDVTELLEAEREMRKLKEFKENVLRSTPIGIFTTDSEGNVTSANAAMLEILGSPSEQETQKFNILELPTIKAIGWDTVFKKVLFQGQSIDEEATYISVWGKRSNVRLKCIPLYEKEKITGLVGIAEDITGRKQVEEAFYESEERYKNLFENSPIGIYRTTPDSRILLANPALVKMLGYSSFDELRIRNLEEEGFEPTHLRTKFKEMMEWEGEVKGLEMEWVRFDGTTINIRENARAIRGNDGRVLFYEGTVEDITESKKAEKELRDSEEKYRSLFENVFDGVYKTTLEGRILMVNPAFVKMLGYDSEDELLSHNALDLYLDPEERKMLGKRMEKEGELHNIELTLKRKDGREVILLENAHAIRDEKGIPLYYEGTLTDITERKKAEQKLSAIHSLSQEMALSKDFTEISRIVFECAERVMNFDNCVIMLVEEEKNELVIAARRGFAQDVGNYRFPLDSKRGTCVWVVRNRKPRIVPDVSKDDRYLPGLEGAASELAVPMMVKDKAIGVLDVESRKLDPFTEADVALLSILANSAAIALQNLRLLEKEHSDAVNIQRILSDKSSLLVQLTKLFEVSNTVTKLTSVQETLDGIVNAIVESGTWRIGIISLKDEKGFMQRCAFAGLTEEEKKRLSENPVSLEMQKIMFDEKMHISRSYYHPHGEPTLRKLDMVTIPSHMPLEECVDWHPEDILFIPFYSKKGDIVGYLNVDEPTDGRRPTEESLKILETFANNASVAIENARLYTQAQKEITERKRAEVALERRAKELAALYETSLEINAQHDLSTLLHAIVMRASSLVDAPMGSLYLMRPDGKSLELVVGYNLPLDHVGAVLQLGEGVSGRVARSGKPLMIEDHSRWEGRASKFENAPYRRILGVPLKFRNRVIGVLNITDTEETGFFSDEEVKLVSSFADQAAIAIENARLLEREKESAQKTEKLLVQLSKLFEVSNTVTKLTSLQETLDTIANAIKDTGAWRKAAISLKHEDGYFHTCAFAGLTKDEQKTLANNPVSPKVQDVLFDEKARISRSYYHLHGGPTIRALDVATVISHMDLKECVDWHPEDLFIIPFYDRVGGFIGYLCVDEPTDGRRPTEETIKILETFANNASVAIENARLHESERESAQKRESLLVQISKLFEVSNTVTKLTSLQQTMDTIVNAIRDSGTWRVAVIALKDEKGYLWRSAFAGVTEEEKKILSESPFSPEMQKSLFDERVRISRSYYHIHGGPTMRALDAVIMPSSMSLEECVDWHPDDLLVIPFYDKAGNILGYLCVDEPTDGRRPAEETIKILETFANNASVAIENARLHESERESAQKRESLLVQLSQLFEVSNSITKLTSLQETLNAIVEAVTAIGAWRCALISLRDERGYFNRCAFSGLTEEEKKKLSENPVSPEIQSVLFDEKMRISRSYYHPHGGPTMRSFETVTVLSDMPLEKCVDWHPEDILIIPFYDKAGNISGYLNVDEPTDGRRPTEESLKVLETFANNAAVAIQNARLFEETTQKATEMGILFEASSVVSSTLAINDVLESVAEQMVKSIDVTDCYISDWNKEEGYITAIAQFISKKEKEELRTELGRRYYLTDFPLTLKVLSEGKPVTLHLLDTNVDLAEIRLLKKYGEKSLLMIPLIVKDNIVGLVELTEEKKEREFSEREIELVTSIANQAAVAIENARLFEAEKKRAAQLAMINDLTKKMTSTLNIKEIAEVVADIQNLFSFYSVELYVREGERLLLLSCAGASEGKLEIGKFQPLEGGMIGWTAKYGKSLLSNDITKEKKYILNVLKDTKSELCIPLRIQTEVVGVLNLESDRVNAFGEEDVYVLETLSGQIASSIKNAKLYSEIRDFSRMLQTKVEEKTAHTEALLETSYALRETTSWEIGLNTIVEGIVKSLKFESAALLLLNERTAMLESKAVAGTDVGMENIRLPLSDTQPVAVKCVKEKRAIDIKDGATDPGVEVQVGTQMSSFAWVPILSQNEALGAIGVANPESGIPISDEDVEILILYANAAALFLEKTRYLISPAIEKRLPTQLKYKLPPMEGFLIFEEKADHAFVVFCDLVTHGMQGFCMSRMAPDLIRKKYRLEKTPIMWLSHSSTKESIDPQDLGKMNHIITEFLHKAEDGVVLLEGLEYLITENDFPRVIKALHALSDAIVLSNARLILPFNPKTLSEKELSILEREFNMLKP